MITKYYNKYSKKILINLKKLHGTPYSIAAGFACGVAISFTPFVGFHIILAAATSWLIRGNIISSAIGTLIGNPWTFPFIWISVLYTGQFFLGLEGNNNIDFLHTFKIATDSLLNLNFKNFGKDVWPIIFPMMIGCIPYYIISWLSSYLLIKKTMEKIQTRKQSQQIKESAS